MPRGRRPTWNLPELLGAAWLIVLALSLAVPPIRGRSRAGGGGTAVRRWAKFSSLPTVNLLTQARERADANTVGADEGNDGLMSNSAETGQVTGTKDKDYNLIWFTEQCLNNALRLETYIQDAERDGDGELAELFRKAQAESRKGAEQGKQLLRSRLSS
jgi:hypothetical protein